MPTKIFVGNLSDDSKSDDLQALFAKFGQVVECDILRNFGFVHMKEEEDAKAAIEALNGYNFDGMKMNVEISHSKPRGGGGGGRGGGPMRRGGGSFRGGPRGRGGESSRGYGAGRSDMYDRPSRDRYDPYDRYPPIPTDLYDLYERERRLPLPPLPFERMLPPALPRDYRGRDSGRDPYARPPPDYYRRDPERYYDRLYDLQRRYEQELLDIYYGNEGPDPRDRPETGPRQLQLPSSNDNLGADSFGRSLAASSYDNGGQGQSSFSRGYSQDFTSDSFLEDPSGSNGPAGGDGRSAHKMPLVSAMFNLANTLKNSHGKPSSGGFRRMDSGSVGQDFYDPFESKQGGGDRFYNAYTS